LKRRQPFLQRLGESSALGVKIWVWAMKMAEVVFLCPRERVCEDIEPIVTIYRSMGTDVGAQLVAGSLENLAKAMADLTARIGRHDLGSLDKGLIQIQQTAQELGMISLGLVAGDLRDCASRADATAFAAVWARLTRLAQRSLLPA
jgi:hypothetical protein